MDTQTSKTQDPIIEEGDEISIVIEEASPYKKLKTEIEGSKDKIIPTDKALSLGTGENSSHSGQNGQHFLSEDSDIEVNPKNSSKIKTLKSENKTKETDKSSLNRKRGKDEMDGQDQKDNNGKKQGKNSKLQEKSKDKEKRRQLQLDVMMEPKEQKSEKARQRAENEKMMSEIAKKYPEYVSDGRWKFPIEDKMFMQYASLLADHIPKIERPKPKRGFIKPQDLGDILKIWNFFDTFSEDFKVEDIQKEEIYASLVYQGEEPLGLLNDMHQGLLSLFLQEFINKNQFDSIKDGHSVPFIPLLKNHVGSDTKEFNGDELALIWSEFARTLARVTPFDDLLSETTKRFFDILGKKTCLEYNKLEYRIKVKILLSLIDGLYETDIFKDMLQRKIEAAEIAAKEKSEVIQDIKEEEETCKDLKAKVTQLANEAGKDSRSYSKALDDLTRQENLINKKRQRLSMLEIQIKTAIQSASLIGVDVHKSEYWAFQAEPNKLYVRIPEIISTEEEWYFYDKKSELNQLIDSLNPKGINPLSVENQKSFLCSAAEFISMKTPLNKTLFNKSLSKLEKKKNF